VIGEQGDRTSIALGTGDVDSVAVSPGGEVVVAMSTGAEVSLRAVDLARGHADELLSAEGAGAARLAFLGDGSLIVARGSTLHRLGRDGNLRWSVDADPSSAIAALAAAGDRLAVLLDREDARALVVQLDGDGAVRWSQDAAPPGGLGATLAVTPSGWVALADQDALLFGPDGALRGGWGTPQAVFPPIVHAATVAFHGDQVVAGGWIRGQTPYVATYRPDR
jgi:hypothetical protein